VAPRVAFVEGAGALPPLSVRAVKEPVLEARALVHADPRVRVAEVFATHYAAIWRLLRRLGVSPSQLDDAAQEVFGVLLRRLGDVAHGKEASFLYGVALRVASNEVRRVKAAPNPRELEQLSLVADERPSPEDELGRRRERRLLDLALDRLPQDLRAVFVLAELEELEVARIAEIEGIPAGTVSSRLRRAREEFSKIAKRLRAELASVKRSGT